MNFSKKYIALLVVALIGLGFGALLGVKKYQALSMNEQAANSLSLQLDEANRRVAICESNYKNYTTSPDVQACQDAMLIASSCQQSLSRCQAESEDTVNATTTLQYVLDGGTILVEQSKGYGRDHFFWLRPKGVSLESEPDPKHVLGSFPALPHPSQDQAVSIERLSNGLSLLTVTADYTEAGESHTAWIDPIKLDFVALGDFSPSDGAVTVSSPFFSDRVLAPHFASMDCRETEKAVVDGVTWQGDLVYTLKQPMRVSCWSSDLHGIDVVSFFGDAPATVSRDLKTVTYPLVNGKKMDIKLNGANKPTITVR